MKERNVFNAIIQHIIKLEGGLSVDASDPGNYANGKLVGTKYGISSKAYPDIDLSTLTKDVAADIYYRDYWVGNKCNYAHRRGLSQLMLDMSINHGCRNANKMLQRAVGVADDGVIGSKTLAAVYQRTDTELLLLLSAERVQFYCQLELFARYGRGWLKRATSIVKHITKEVHHDFE